MLLTREQDGYLLAESNIKGFFDKGLAPQQLRSLILRAEGLTAKEVSQELNCSEATENKRMQTINFKLKAKNVTQAVAIALRKGIISYLAIATLFMHPDVDGYQELARLRSGRPTYQLQARTRREDAI